jgi:hypothetical protein
MKICLNTGVGCSSSDRMTCGIGSQGVPLSRETLLKSGKTGLAKNLDAAIARSLPPKEKRVRANDRFG